MGLLSDTYISYVEDVEKITLSFATTQSEVQISGTYT